MHFIRFVLCVAVCSALGGIPTDRLLAQDPGPSKKDDEVARLKEKVSRLEEELAELKNRLQDKTAQKQGQEGEKTEEEKQLEAELAAELGEETPSAQPPSPPQAPPTPQVTGARGGLLQNMNPNIGVIGNFLGRKVIERQSEEDGFTMDEAEFSFQMVIDPFARADVFVAVVPPEEAVELEEAYVTLLALPASLQGRLGRMRPLFGKLNLTHPPETPFADQIPRVLVNFFGEEGFVETGASLSYLLPNPWDLFMELSLGAFDGGNDVSFNGDATSDLLYFGHLKNFFNLSDNASVELGFSAATGKNDTTGDFRTNLYGVDMIYRWKPLRRSQYRSLTWQSEAIFSNREELGRTLNSWGLFSFLEYQLSKRWFLGGRFDYSEIPQAPEANEVAYSAILTFWPSEFQTIRLQYRHLNRSFAEDDNAIFLQWVFITGAHGAHPF